MGSITTWQRLEPLPSSDDLDSGLRAEIADPLWLLARQRQFGEFRGDDAGSPDPGDAGRPERTHLALPPRSTGSARRHPRGRLRRRSLPLEALAEREPVRGAAGDGGLAVEAGLHFLRLLRKHRAAGRRVAYLTALRTPGRRPAR